LRQSELRPSRLASRARRNVHLHLAPYAERARELLLSVGNPEQDVEGGGEAELLAGLAPLRWRVEGTTPGT
jgi:hypothetical protein